MALVARKNHLPGVYRWVKERGLVRKSGQSNEYTHTVLDGGFVMFGPIDVLADAENIWLRLFYSEYARSWEAGERLYMVEWPRPQQPHRLYFDFDMYFANNTPNFPATELQHMFACIQTALQNAVFRELPGDRFTLLVGSGGWSAAKKRLGRDRQERAYQKLGFHLIWTDIWINTAWLPAIREQLVLALETQFSNGCIPLVTDAPAQLHNPWSSVVDEHIAKRASSRMFGSAKLDWCSCRKEKQECLHDKERQGKGKGRIDVGRVYTLAAVVNNNGEQLGALFDHLNNNKVQLLFAASLCLTPPADGVPDDITVDVNAQPSRSKEVMTDMPPDDKNCAMIKHYLRNCYGAELTKIQYSKRSKVYTCQSTSRRCFNNFDQNHGSAANYFLVSFLVYLRV